MKWCRTFVLNRIQQVCIFFHFFRSPIPATTHNRQTALATASGSCRSLRPPVGFVFLQEQRILGSVVEGCVLRLPRPCWRYKTKVYPGTGLSSFVIVDLMIVIQCVTRKDSVVYVICSHSSVCLSSTSLCMYFYFMVRPVHAAGASYTCHANNSLSMPFVVMYAHDRDL